MKPSLTLLIICLSILQIPAQTITVNINWANSIREIPSHAYGINSPANFIPSYSNDAIYIENLNFITKKKALIRLHGWGMLGDSPETWQENGLWNSEKINNALTPLVEQEYQLMINIPSGPLGEADYQNPEVFAKFCADLVQIVNIDHQLGIEYWEIPNEREQGFAVPGLSINEMAALFQKARQAMKKIDPSIKVGGPATAWVNVDYLRQFVTTVFPNIDFITCHTYSGDCSNSLADAYDIAQNASADLATLRQQINAITGTTYLPIFLTEYNISYQGCDRIQSYEGAVNDAIIMTESIAAGIDATNYWAVAPYSDMSFIEGAEYFEIAHLYEIFNQSFHGDLFQSQSSDSTKVIIYATRDLVQNNFSFCLINRTSETQSLDLQFENWLPTDFSWHLFDAQNDYASSMTNWSSINNGQLNLTPYSVNLFVSETISSTMTTESDYIVMFPNPTTGKVYFSSQFINDKFELISSLGTIVKRGVIKSNEIDFSDLESGIYFVKIEGKKLGLIVKE